MKKKIVLMHLCGLVFFQFLLVSLVHADIPANLLKSAENGNAGAQFTVARSYELGKRVKSDKAKAIQWYTKAADQGHTDAAYRLGLLYYKGLGGFKIDLKKAFNYLSQAAKANHKNSQANLAKMYANGDGVARNEQMSDYWYEQAFTAQTQSFAEYMKAQEEGVDEQPVPVKTSPVVKKPKPRKKVVREKSSTPVKKAGVRFPQSILAGKWLQNGKPSTYITSSITKCKTKKSKLVCSTSKLKGRHSSGIFEYKMRSIISRGEGAKDISIQYRILYTAVPEETIGGYDDEDDVGTKDVLVVGWEKKSHSIKCKFESNRAILCRPVGEDAFYLKRK